MSQPRPPTPPQTGYDVMQRLLPGIEKVARAVAARWRSSPGWTEADCYEPQRLVDDDEAQAFLAAVGRRVLDRGGHPADADYDAQVAGQHMVTFVRHEACRRKTFWVDPPLAWMLARTRLDIDGELLRLPFAACAFILSDIDARERAGALLAADGARRKTVRTVSAYLAQPPENDGARPLYLNLLLDRQDGEWPYIYSRDLLVEPRARIDDILDSHFPEVADGPDPIFRSPEMKELIHLVLNAVLYSTSAGVEPVVIESPRRKLREAKGQRRRRAVEQEVERALRRTTGEDVFFLPGKIDIRNVRRLQEVEARPEGRALLTRFMVRGHWRRAAENWANQRPRWIEPYWKGPEMGVAVEREYRLKE